MAGIEELCSGARKTPARAELFANCITQTCVQMQGVGVNDGLELWPENVVHAQA